MKLTFVELAAFTEEVLTVATDEELRQLQLELESNPERGDLIQNSGGLRKARMKLPGRGRSAGARVIYLWLPRAQKIIFFVLYTKAKITSIPPATLGRYRAAVGQIKATYDK